MQQILITIPDEAYAEAQNRAVREGFSSAEGFISELVAQTIGGDTGADDQVFSPEVLVAIDLGAQQSADGNVWTRSQVREFLAAKKSAWQEQRAS